MYLWIFWVLRILGVEMFAGEILARFEFARGARRKLIFGDFGLGVWFRVWLVNYLGSNLCLVGVFEKFLWILMYMWLLLLMGCANEIVYSFGSGSANVRFVDCGGFDDVNFFIYLFINSWMILIFKFFCLFGVVLVIFRLFAYVSALNVEFGESVMASELLWVL